MHSMEGPRAAILTLLQQQNEATVEELSKQVGLACATVRRHLDILQRDRLVAYKQVRKKTGRPEHSFFLTESGQEALPKGYNRLLSDMLQEMRDMAPEDLQGMDGRGLAKLLFLRLADRAAVEGSSEGCILHSSEHLSKVLGEWGFAPQIEKLPGQMRVHLINCPFRQVALEDNSVCAFDERLIGNILGRQAMKERSVPQGHPSCSYLVIAGVN